MKKLSDYLMLSYSPDGKKADVRPHAFQTTDICQD